MLIFSSFAYAEPAPAPNPPAPVAQPQTTPTPQVNPAIAPDGHVRKAILILPVYIEGRIKELWQDENKWRNIWYEAALESGAGLVVVPLGDLDDRVDVDDSNVDAATSNSLSRMYSRYAIGKIYIATAFYNLKADPKPTLEVTIKQITPEKTETVRSDYIIRTTENLDGLMARAANDIAQNIYKQQSIDRTKIEFERLKEINALVNVSDITEWEALRKKLLARGNIVSIRLTSISFYETNMVITFKGTPEMLGKTLVTAGLRVMQDGDSLVLALK